LFLDIGGGDNGNLPGAEHPKHGKALPRSLYPENAANGVELDDVIEDSITATFAR